MCISFPPDEFHGILAGFDPNAPDNPFEHRPEEVEPIGAYVGETEESQQLRDDIL